MKHRDAEFQILDFAPRKPSPRREAIKKNGVAPAMSRPSAWAWLRRFKFRASSLDVFDGLLVALGAVTGLVILILVQMIRAGLPS